MDQQDTLRNLLIAFAVFFAVMWIAPRLLPPPPQPAPGTETTSQETSPVEVSQPVATPEGSPGQASPSSTDAPGAGKFTVIEAEMVETLSIGAELAQIEEREDAPEDPYRMRLTLSNVGASVESATMTDHAQLVDDPARYELLSLVERDDGRQYRSLAVEKINIDDVDLTLHDKKWNVVPVGPCETSRGDQGEKVEFWIEIREGDVPAVKLTRTLCLPQQSKESGRHDVESSINVASLSTVEHKVLISFRGGLGISQENPRMDYRHADVGISSRGFVNGSRKNLTEVVKQAGKPIEMYSSSAVDPGTRLSWASTGNTYFMCTIAPLARNGSREEAGYINTVEAFDADGSTLTTDDGTVRLVTLPEEVPAGGSLSYPADLYVGEKNVRTFKTQTDYKRRNYYYQVSKGYGWCTFIWLVELMIWLLNGLFAVVRDFGVAIIILVLVVRTLLHPITKKGQVNMVRMQHRMQELAPKIEEIKKKYANDKARMNQEMMKLNMNPAGQLLTCLPMLIQMPIWIALYLSLSNNVLMRHEACVFLPWINDLTAPDALFTFSSPIVVPLFGWVLPSFNLLPILVAVFMYTQQKLQPKPAPSPNQTDQQRQQQEMMQKMMPMMSIMMLLIFYKMPSGLNLYIMSSSLFGTIEQKRIRSHIKEREANGTLHKPEKKAESKPGPPGKRRKPSFIKKLQVMAEEAQKAQAQRPRKSKGK
ncbi:MAG: YidC/Oxa1 family insertase periplasmic-domain containing protein [Phycisphaerales bacterium]|nr:MAG: YidC/Oxa1 family insertase periplasmic-domain containing protein [Phycisphaerales bacterium]